MGTLPNLAPNPSPNPYPNRNSLPNTLPNPNPNPSPPSYEDVSKLFSLPLSDAAQSLGVCSSVLKKVCYDNGLVRWPFRKFVSGKSIEEIKKDAAIEKEKQHVELKVAPERNSFMAISSLSPQPQGPNIAAVQGSPTPRTLTQPPAKDNQIEIPHNLHSLVTNQGSSPMFDEFKYGFPSEGLSSVSYRWWGNKTSIETGKDSEQNGGEDDKEKKQQPKDSVDTAVNFLSMNGEVNEGEKNNTDPEPDSAFILSAFRKKAAKDGRQALKLGVYKGYHVKTLDRTKKQALVQIFKSSLPDEWGNMFSES